MNRIKSTILTLVSFCIGAGILATAFDREVSDSIGSFIFSLVMGGFCLFAGIVFFKLLCIPAWKNEENTLKDEVNDMVTPNQAGKADADDEDELISDFRRSVYDFFSCKGIAPNSIIQTTATQLYWHLLYLQKLRMNKKNVSLNFEAERKTYGGISVTKTKYFDGKYEITEARERIACKRTYSDGRFNYVKTDNELAAYNILNAKTEGATLLTCPNCGSKSTRENLIDGCDYCGTKFSIEDLGKKISNFTLRRDYEIEYAKYKDRRSFFKIRAFLFCAIPAFLFSLICMIIVSINEEEGIVMSIVASLIGAGFMAGACGFFGSICFGIFIFPIIQLKEDAKYSFFKKLQTNNKKNDDIEQSIKRNDPLFSMEHFFSNVQNKLATIHYADKSEQISVFAEKDLIGLLEKYADIVDMDVTDITLEECAFDETQSRISLSSSLNLIRLKDTGFCETEEKLYLSLVKNSACKTEAVCEPSVLKCKDCGNSVSLLEGGRCQFCGSRLNLKEYDWVIDDYKVLSGC